MSATDVPGNVTTPGRVTLISFPTRPALARSRRSPPTPVDFRVLKDFLAVVSFVDW